LWDVPAGRELARLQGHAWLVPGVTFAPDRDTLATANADGTVKLWDQTDAGR
jgi:WD40 repeat protein